MKISEDRLRELVIEEVYLRLLDHYIDIEFDKILAESVEADWKAAKRKAMKKKARDAVLGIAGAATVGGPLVMMSSDYEKAKAEKFAQDRAERQAAAETLAVKRQELIDYINNPAAFRWGVGGETMMQLPGQEGYGGTSVLPPSYTVIQQVYLDKMSGKPRFGIPSAEEIPKMGQQDLAAKGDPDKNLASFFTDYSTDDMIDAYEFMKQAPHVSSMPGSGIESKIIMLSPASLSPDYVLPENGMTVKDYYNWAFFNQFLSSEERSAFEMESQTQQHTVDAPDSGMEDIKPSNVLDITPQKQYTWKEYKNRKKRLA